MMELLDSKYPKQTQYNGILSPLIIVDGNVYEMCSQLIYCCLLHMNEILAIIKSSLNSGNFGATELSGIQGLYG